MKKKLTVCILLLVLLTACGQKQTLQETIPALSLVTENGQTMPVNVYSYSWTAGRESVVVDTAHPLQALDQLPSVSVSSGSQAGLGFSRIPGIVTVTYWPVSTAEAPSPWPEQTVETTFANSLFLFTPPESGEDLVFLVQGQWNSGQDAYGTAAYAFVLKQS